MSRSIRIMIVDDEPNIRLTARLALEADGHEVVGAEDGEEAIEQLAVSPVDLILLDLRMPLLDGLETLRHLREIGDKTPVVIVTAHGAMPDAIAAMKLAAIDFLQKPMTPQSLRRVVADFVARRPEPPPDSAATPPAEAVRVFDPQPSTSASQMQSGPYSSLQNLVAGPSRSRRRVR